MVRKIPRKIKSDILTIICCLIGLIIITMFSKYYIANNKSFNNLVNIRSNRLIDEKYDLSLEYYLVYDDITFFQNYKISMLFIPNELQNLVLGTFPKNEFEIIVPQKYKFLLNKFINVNIHGKLQKFKVVGTYDVGNFFYTNLATMIKLYEKNNIKLEYYHYIFIVDEYLELNDNLDILNENGYDVAIKNSDTLYRLSNYTTLVEFFVLLQCFMLTGVAISIISMFTKE